MKTIGIIASLYLISNVSVLAQSSQSIDQMSWLVGSWQRTKLEKQDRKSFETWSTDNSGLTGLGVTLKGADTVFSEKLAIILKEDALYYVATVSHNDGPVHFKLTEISRSSMQFENAKHDFPKTIRYEKLSSKKMKATISDGKQSVAFHFSKVVK